MSCPSPTPLNRFHRLLLTGLSAVCIATTGIVLEANIPQPVQGAEDIRLRVTGPILLTLSVESLETFAETGEITGDLRTYARFLDDETLALLRNGLNFKIPLDLITVDHLTYSPLGRDALYNLGKVFQIQWDINGAIGLRAALIGAAAQADAEGWTFIDVLQQFPTSTIDIALEDLLVLFRELSVYFSYNDAVVTAIQNQAIAEAVNQSPITVTDLSDLSQSGPFDYQIQTFTVNNSALRQTQDGLTVDYDFDVDMYVPSGLTSPAPIVIISHGFGDVKESFEFLAQHVASYGYVAIVPEHVGSNLEYRQEYLQGRLHTLLSPMEFINRPQEISFIIDTLEALVIESPEWAAILDVNRIGVAGDSLGSTTTLAIAGAEINYSNLVDICERDSLRLNFALYLECRAQYLPPQNYDLSDPRVTAVITGHPLGAALYGPEGTSQIDVPLLMVSGSEDIVSPVVTEQFHPFVWLQSAPKYLALLDVGTHFSSKPGEDAEGFFKLIAGEHRDVGSMYYKALTIAFWNIYLRGQDEYVPYLTARAAQQFSEGQPMTLDVITSLTPEHIETAYGQPTPVPIIPSDIETVPPRAEDILSEIKASGVLKIAFRRDAAPFGFIDSQDRWAGYCGDLAIALSRYLTRELGLDVDVQVAELSSNLTNRFDLVRNENVHLECGPNTIREDVEGIQFSNPIFVTSTQFLIPEEQETNINPNTPLVDARLGVLENSTTQTFLETTYPEATIITFSGLRGRQEGVEAAATGEIDAFVGDGILSYAELQLDGYDIDTFSLIPDLPLTCDYYGLILPNNDPEWRSLINTFLSSEEEGTISVKWFEELYPATLDKTTVCLNR